MKPRSNPFLVLALTLAVLPTTLSAAIFTWDTTSGDSAIVGGIGTWNTTATTPGPVNTNWTTDVGVTNISWPATSSGDDDALFGGTGGAVTIESPGITANSVTFTSASYVIGGSPLTLDSLDPDGAGPLLPPAPNISAGPGSNTQSATINANIISANGLSKTGGSTLTLGGDLSGVVGTLTIDGAVTSPANNAAGIQLQSGVSTSGLTGIDIKNNSFLALGGVSLGASIPIILNGGGGNNAPQGAVRGTAGANTVAGNITINDANVRIGNTGTSTTFSGPITAVNPVHGILIRIGSNQGVILTNTGNSWGGTTNLAEGSLYCAPGALPATPNLSIGASAGAEFGTNGTFTRAIGTGTSEVSFGRGTDGLRPMGFSARGGALNVNIGGSVPAADFTFVPVTTIAATTNGTFITTSANVTVASATGIAVGQYVSGTGLGTDSRVTAISGTTVTLNRNPTSASAASPGNALTFTTLAPLDNTKFNTFTLVLNGANADSALTFQNPIDLNGFNRFLQVSANTATLTGGLKNSSASAASARKTGAGTLIHDPGVAHTVTLAGLNTNAGTLELKSGTVTVSGNGSTAQPDSTNGFTVARGGTFRLSGATVNVTGGGFVFTSGNTIASTSSFILDSGTFDAGTKEVLNAYGATGSTTLNGGTFICGAFRVGQGTGTLNLNGGTLRANNLSTGGGTTTVNFNGGTLQARGNNANFVPTSLTNTVVRAGGAVIDTNNFNVTIAHPLTEDPGSTGGGLSKLSTGSLTLTGANTYTGATSVTLGTLALVGGSQTSPITVNSGAALGFTLGSPTTSTSSVTFSGATAKVTVTGTPVAATLMTASSITGTPVLDPAIPGFELAIEGSGTLLNLKATSGGPFDTWATTTNGLSGGDAAATADPDNDGLDNAVEFVIGGQPNPANPNANSSALAPTISTDVNNLIFTYRRTDLALTQAGIGITAQYGSDLIGWTTATNGENGVVIAVTNDIEVGVDQVQVTIPKSLATGAKMFARLNVVIP